MRYVVLGLLLVSCTTPVQEAPSQRQMQAQSSNNLCLDLISIICEKSGACVDGYSQKKPGVKPISALSEAYTAECVAAASSQCRYVHGIDENEFRACGWAILQSPCPPEGEFMPTPDACYGIADM